MFLIVIMVTNTCWILSKRNTAFFVCCYIATYNRCESHCQAHAVLLIAFKIFKFYFPNQLFHFLKSHHLCFRDLLRLNVGRNHLSEIPSQSLLPLKNLNHLDMSANKIYELKGRPFDGNKWESHLMWHVSSPDPDKIKLNIFSANHEEKYQ